MLARECKNPTAFDGCEVTGIQDAAVINDNRVTKT